MVLAAITRQQSRAQEEQVGLELAELEKEKPSTTPVRLGKVGVSSHGTSGEADARVEEIRDEV